MTTHCYTGQLIGGKYQVLDLLGEGGMGAVYLAQHKLLGKRVAAKFLHRKIAKKEAIVTRFYREAKAATEIDHPNVVDILDIGATSDGTPYIIMEYMAGESLAELLERTGPLPLGAACAIFEQLLAGVGAAHKKGIIHRDLKPDNIYLIHREKGPPVAKIIDFGISKFTCTPKNTQLTLMGDMLGTPAYMAPEQIRGGKSIDFRVDIYAIGVIAYEVLTGKRPFAGNDYSEVFAATLTEPPPSPEEIYPEFPKEAKSFLMTLLEKRPEHRPATTENVMELVKAFSDYSQRHQMLATACDGYVSRVTVESGDYPSLAQFDDAINEIQSSTAISTSNFSNTLVNRNRKLVKIVAMLSVLLIAVVLVWATIRFSSTGSNEQEAAVLPKPISLVQIQNATAADTDASLDVTNTFSANTDSTGHPIARKTQSEPTPVPIQEDIKIKAPSTRKLSSKRSVSKRSARSEKHTLYGPDGERMKINPAFMNN